MKTSTIILSLMMQILAVFQSARAQTKPVGDPVPYRLLAGSSLLTETATTPGAPVQSRTGALSGVFSFTRQISPLDFDVYQLDNLHWLSVDAQGAQRLEGTGSYGVTSRFGNTKEITLKLRIDGTPVELTSGAVPNDENWPQIDIVAKGSVQKGKGKVDYTLHLIAAPELQVWHYRLFEGSYFMDDCPICERVSIPEPMRGSFDLVLIDNGPLYSRFLLRDIEFTTSWNGINRKLTGQGTYQMGGEVAALQQMTLELELESPEGKQSKGFTNSSSGATKDWPMLDVSLDETTGTLAHLFRLRLNAAPFWEIWFSTVASFTSGHLLEADRTVTNGDILSDMGRVVTPRADLLRGLNLSPPSNSGVDAFTMLPGGEQAFSLNETVTSQALGNLGHGDLLSDGGQVILRNEELLAPFGLMPTSEDMGLDAVQVLDSEEILFSIKTDAFSELKGTTLHHGDLLSSSGEVRKSYQQLLAAFHTPNPAQDYGLDAAYVWPSGESWFSVAQGFFDEELGDISEGDLLSDHGYIVFRNLELLRAFAPLERIANFGLDGLYVVTDAVADATAPGLSIPVVDNAKNSVSLKWSGKGRVFQVQKVDDLRFPMAPASPIAPGSSWTGPGNSPVEFYQLRQW